MNPRRTTRRLALVAAALTLPLASASAAVSASAPPTTPPDSAPVDSVPVELPEGYVWLVDDTGVITIAVPEAWADVDTAPVPEGVDGNPQPWIAAAPTSIDDFLAAFDEPGVLYEAFPFDPDPLFYLEAYSITEGCSSLAVEDFSSHGFTGLTSIGTGCGENGEATWQLVVASSADQSFTAKVQVQTVSDGDIEAVELALDSFTTTGAPMATINSSVPGSDAPATPAPETTEASG